MSDRKFGNLMPHRQGISWRVYDLINRKSCIHVDAWLYQDNDDTLYLYVEYSAAGRQIVNVATWYIDTATYTLVPAYPLTASDIGRMLKRHINSPWARKYHPMLATIHDKDILPLMYAYMGAAFKGYRSIALAYIWTHPKINDPMDGLVNYYNDTLRAERDDDFSLGAKKPGGVNLNREYEKATRLPPKERSIMRTLDKVLRNSNST